MSVTIKQNLVSSSKYSIKCPNKMNPEYITVHNTANDASAENEIKYMISNNNQVSYHFAVDDKEIIQGLPLDRNAWHCGDGKGNGNMKSIGVEICYSKSGGTKYKAAEENAVILIAQLLKERSWGIDRVKQHHDWSGKDCPHRIRAEGTWTSFLSRIQSELNKTNDNKTYRIITGTFTTKEQAEKGLAKMKATGAIGVGYVQQSGAYWRVATGTFKSKSSAEKAMSTIKNECKYVMYLKEA